MEHAFPPENFQREKRTTFFQNPTYSQEFFNQDFPNFLVNGKRTEYCDPLKRVLRLRFDNSPLYKQGNWAELNLAKTFGTVTI